MFEPIVFFSKGSNTVLTIHSRHFLLCARRIYQSRLPRPCHLHPTGATESWPEIHTGQRPLQGSRRAMAHGSQNGKRPSSIDATYARSMVRYFYFFNGTEHVFQTLTTYPQITI